MISTDSDRDLACWDDYHFIQIGEKERLSFLKLIEKSQVSPYRDFETFFVQAALAFRQLSERVRRPLIEFRRLGNTAGALLIRGLPVDSNLPITPEDSHRSVNKTTWASEFSIAAFASVLGDPFAYIQEKEGEIFQNICPTRQNELMLSSESSKILLDFHTETAFHPFMPDYVALYCLRQDHDKQARTLVSGIRKMYLELSLDQKFLLRQPLFEAGVDYSFGNRNLTRGGCLVTPVLFGEEADPLLRFDPDLMKGKTAESQKILVELNRIAHRVAVYVILEPGDLLIIDNKRAVHARTIFNPRYDGNDRWLQRMFVTRDLNASASDRNIGERIIRTEFTI
jgi:hypothetical protein